MNSAAVLSLLLAHWPVWTVIDRGIEISETAIADPRPLRIVAARIDLRDPGIDFVVTPSNGEKAQETDGLTTSSFLKAHGCRFAINASPFAPVVSPEGEPKDVLGLSVSRGERYSEPEKGKGALVISRDNRARIVGPGMDPGEAWNAVGGFGLLLADGRNVGADDALHPRTAVGISRDGRWLYLLVIDGRQPGYSEGTTTRETAEILLQLGAHEGLNLDGGGSTALIASDGKGDAVAWNRPIHAGVPGRERVNANHLGILVRPAGGGESR